MSNQVFIDTSAFKALVDPKDDFHKAVEHIWSKLQEEDMMLITTNYILDESFTLIRSRCGVEIVDAFRRVLARSPNLKVVRVTSADEGGAWKWFTKDWSKLSFTDCVSFAVMKRLRLQSVVSFDDHFKRAGFQIIL